MNSTSLMNDREVDEKAFVDTKQKMKMNLLENSHLGAPFTRRNLSQNYSN